jgi:hypothetical protein
MPLVLQDWLAARLDTVARIEPDGIYSRWPAGNGEFLARLAVALHAYQAEHDGARIARRIRLAKLRADLAHRIVRDDPADLIWCRTCADVTVEPHPATHVRVPLVHLPQGQTAPWFAEFVAMPANRLDPRLVEREGLPQVATRTQRGDFGPAFQRRWLRYRSRRLADLTTHHLRRGVDAVRRAGSRIDFYFDAAYAYVVDPDLQASSRADRPYGYPARGVRWR